MSDYCQIAENKFSTQMANAIKVVNEREKISKEYTSITGKSAFKAYNDSVKDTPYNYVNKNISGNSPVAKLFLLYTEANYTSNSKKTEFNGLGKYGQEPIEGNEVPIANTLTAFIMNNNEKTTAKIGLTTPEKLAENFFSSVNNIEVGVTQNIQVNDKNELLAKNIDSDNKPPRPFEIKTGINSSDGILNENELDANMSAYTIETRILSAKNQLGKINGQALDRTASASTVKIDEDDPYNAFFKKIASIDGEKGVTKEELAKGIDAISEKTPDGTLLFTNEKLMKYIKEK